MKILNVMQCTHLGGTEQFALRLMTGLVERGHQCRVVSLHPIAELGPLLDAQHIDAVSVGYEGKFGWRSHLKLRRVLRTVDFGPLLMMGPTLSAMLALPKKIPGQKRVLIALFHHQGVKAPWQWRLLYGVANHQFDMMTFGSEFTRAEALRMNPAIESKAMTVYAPIPMPESIDISVKSRGKAELGIKENELVVGNAGWLIERKRFDVFLQVAARIKVNFPNACFLIAGDGPEKEKLVHLSRNLGLEGSVRWLGWRRDLSAFYQSLDLMVFNSDWDTFPTTPLEALSYAIPVVASVEHGGLKEVITDRRVGILLNSHDIEKLAGFACQLLRDPQQAGAMGRAGREKVMQLCSIDKCVDTYSELLGLPPTFAERSSRQLSCS